MALIFGIDRFLRVFIFPNIQELVNLYEQFLQLKKIQRKSFNRMNSFDWILFFPEHNNALHI